MGLNYFNKVWWSAIGDPDEYSTPDAGYLNVSTAGGPITGLKALGDYLFIFQESCYTVWQKRLGDVPFSLLGKKEYGCNSFRTIVEIGGALYYLSSEGDIRVTNGNSDVSVSDGIKEISKGIINGRATADYYGSHPNTMPNALYDRYNNAYRLYYAGTSTSCDKCLTYFIDKGIWTSAPDTDVMATAPAVDATTYVGLVGNSDSSGVTYNLLSKYGDPGKAGTLDLGYLASGSPNQEIKLHQVKVWVHADAGQAGDNCDCTMTASVYTDPSTNTAYGSESETIAYNSTGDNLQEIEFNNIDCISHYIRVVLTDSGTKRNYSIARVLITYDVMNSTR